MKALTPQELELWKTLEEFEPPGEALLAWVPFLMPRYKRPEHLLPLARAFYRVDRGEEVFFLSSTPPRHGKSESILSWCVRHLARHPEQRIAYVTYAAEFANEQSRKAMRLAAQAGLNIHGKASVWSTPQGGGMYFLGVDGQITGRGINTLIVDDPIKSRKEAESPTVRESVYQGFTANLLTRFNPEGPPQVIINMARWHDDDLVGRLLNDQREGSGINWEYMNLEAIGPSGEPLWTQVWPKERLEQRRKMVGEYDWASLYMGSPMPRDGYVFREPVRYRVADVAGARIAIGCDPAATAKTSADYSVITVVAAKGSGLEQTCDVLDVWRGQVEIPKLVEKLARMQDHWGAPAFVEAVGGFKAVPQMLRQIRPGLRVVDVSVSTDKFTRSLPLKAAWNAGRVRVPQPGATGWVDEYVREVCKFTGKGDAKDDQVDATVHAFTAIDQRSHAMRRGVHVLQGGAA